MQNNFPYKSIWEFLEQHNLKDKSQEEIKKYKDVYWKNYRRYYQKRLQTTHKKLSFSLERSVYDEVKNECENRKWPVARFCSEGVTLLLRQSASMSEGTKDLLRVLLRMESLLINHIRNSKDPIDELHFIQLKIQEIESLIRHLYDSQE